MRTIHLAVTEEFAYAPGPRRRVEGPHSAEEFLDKHLAPKFEEACRTDRALVIDLDRGAGFAASFLDEAFGGLARRFGIEEVTRRVVIISLEEPYLEEEIHKHIAEAFDRG